MFKIQLRMWECTLEHTARYLTCDSCVAVWLFVCSCVRRRCTAICIWIRMGSTRQRRVLRICERSEDQIHGANNRYVLNCIVRHVNSNSVLLVPMVIYITENRHCLSSECIYSLRKLQSARICAPRSGLAKSALNF